MTDELPIVLLHGSATGSYSWAADRIGVVQGIDYLERNLRRFMRPARRHIALDMRLGSNRIEYQPLGVVGIISSWNYPVNLSLMPVVTAIAAGLHGNQPLDFHLTHEETGHRSQAVRYLRRKRLHRQLFPLRHRPFDNRSRLDSTLAVGTVSYTLDSPQH